MKQFNFLKYILEKEGNEYLKDFESQLSSYYYSQYFRAGEKGLFSKKGVKESIYNYSTIIIGLVNQVLKIYIIKSKNSIISDSYFNFNDKLKEIGYKVIKPPWILDKKQINSFDYSIYNKYKIIYNQANHGLLNLMTQKFKKNYEEFQAIITSYIKEINSPALFLPADVSFCQKTLINAYKSIDKPSFIHLHGGMPASYKPYRFSGTDYLLVWGEKQKKNYIKNGFSAEKIIVTGHPYYTELPKNYNKLRFNLDNILILSKSLLGAQKNDGIIRLQDKANSLLYLYQLEDLLSELGVKSVKLRLHPSEDKDFFYRNINTDFFKMENISLKKALNNATLVIGPKSTVFIEALYYGVNYILYEPQIDGKDMVGLELTSPLTDNDGKIPCAFSLDDLRYIIKTKSRVHHSVIEEYINTPFDLTEVKNIIDSYR